MHSAPPGTPIAPPDPSDPDYTMSTEDVATLLGTRLLQVILNNAPVETVKELLDEGAPVWFQDAEEGMTALHAAAYVRNTEVVKFLISKGAIWNAGEWIEAHLGRLGALIVVILFSG